jgi:hypothetical protein
MGKIERHEPGRPPTPQRLGPAAPFSHVRDPAVISKVAGPSTGPFVSNATELLNLLIIMRKRRKILGWKGLGVNPISRSPEYLAPKFDE